MTAIEARLREALGTKVSISNGKNYTGALTIEYYGRDELERLIDLLAPEAKI